MLKTKNYLLISLLIIFVVANVFYTIGIATSSAEVAKYERDEEELVSQNQSLGEQIMNKSSLRTIEITASELGFAKPQKVIYITQSEAVAARLP